MNKLQKFIKSIFFNIIDADDIGIQSCDKYHGAWKPGQKKSFTCYSKALFEISY